VSALTLPRSLLEGSFGTLRACGAGRRECVLYWCASLEQPDRLIRAVHPVHRAGPTWYGVESAWINPFFLDLRRVHQTVRVQVHTHPSDAGHSAVDDRFSLVPAAGFRSLVIPGFAMGPIEFTDTALVQMQPDGAWGPLSPEEVFQLE
jgi:hypothetical protein